MRALLRSGLLGLLVCVAISESAWCRFAWSPDGQWVAFTTMVTSQESQCIPGWSLQAYIPKLPEEASAKSWDLPSTTDSRFALDPTQVVTKLWIHRPEDGRTLLLRQESGLMSSPCWSPDGRRLAMCRLQTHPEVSEEFLWSVEILGTDPKETIVVKELSRSPWPGLDWSRRILSWNGRGDLLAVPRGHSMGLQVLEVKSGRVVKTWDQGILPSWSPSDQVDRLAFYQSSADPGLFLWSAGESSAIALSSQLSADQPPLWSRRGKMLLTSWIRKVPKISGTGWTEQTEMAFHDGNGQRIQVGRTEAHVLPLDKININCEHQDDSSLQDPTFVKTRGVWVAALPDQEVVYLSTLTPDADQFLIRYQIRRQVNERVFAPLSVPRVPLTDLSCSPDGRYLALRCWDQQQDHSVPALISLDGRRETLIPLVPDETTGRRWLGLFAGLLQQVAREGIERELMTDPRLPDRRPTIWPVPQPPQGGMSSSLTRKRLTKLARMAKDHVLAKSSRWSEPVSAELTWICLWFANDLEAAQRSWSRFWNSLSQPDDRERALAARVLLDLDLQRWDEAKLLQTKIGEDNSLSARKQIYQWSVEGPQLVTQDNLDDRLGWDEYVSQVVESHLQSRGEVDLVSEAITQFFGPRSSLPVRSSPGQSKPASRSERNQSDTSELPVRVPQPVRDPQPVGRIE